MAEAESLGGDELFTGELLVDFGQLVHADWVTYNELDRVRRRSLLAVSRLGDDDEGGDTLGRSSGTSSSTITPSVSATNRATRAP